MFPTLTFALALLPFVTLAGSRVTQGQEDEADPMKFALDGMVELMEGGGAFDQNFYDELVACFNRFDPELKAAQDTEWSGMLWFAESGGIPGDQWLSCDQLDEFGIVRDRCITGSTIRSIGNFLGPFFRADGWRIVRMARGQLYGAGEGRNVHLPAVLLRL